MIFELENSILSKWNSLVLIIVLVPGFDNCTDNCTVPHSLKYYLELKVCNYFTNYPEESIEKSSNDNDM